MSRQQNDHSEDADWDHWIDTLVDQGVNLTTWETEFVESVDRQRQDGRPLSEKQSRILERIYSQRTT